MGTTDNLLDRIVRDKSVDVIDQQLLIFGPRYMQYRRDYTAAGRQELELDFPLYVLFEHTFRCNLRCPCCLQGYQSEKVKYDTGVPVMPLALFMKVIRECEEKGCPSVAMHNCDEPLLVKDISERIKIAKGHGIMDIFMTTNGQLLTESLAQEVCEAGLSHILFSVDAATAETYEAVRVRGIFEKTLHAIDYIQKWKKSAGAALPIVRASFVVNRKNQHETDMFVKGFRVQVDYIDIQSFYSIDNLNRHLAPSDHFEVDPKNFVCSEPFRKIIVRANGDVAPCCSVFGYKQIVGNVYESSIGEIWNGEKMRDLRKSLKRKQFNAVCTDCISNLYERRS